MLYVPLKRAVMILGLTASLNHSRRRAMLGHADLLCPAWDGEKLIGVARSITDFEYCCYLSIWLSMRPTRSRESGMN